MPSPKAKKVIKYCVIGAVLGAATVATCGAAAVASSGCCAGMAAANVAMPTALGYSGAAGAVAGGGIGYQMATDNGKK